ncbi:helix-turn-helix domain-containing protein [Bacteroides caccae]|uniref:helix-turn-helix domain-containing protein n=1 Tax=Bacteroides caccae TaxID=47678 RepID=UPI0022AAC25D|nr:helix-turn-helix transcriptional regulator [Bacteroides caccae]MCZ2726239.1 helix-turn-helix transcriptional regulator [Bacteroides caccae]
MANLLIIKELLKQKKITIRDFASDIGMTEQALQLLIRKNSTKIETLELIAKKLNVSVSIFFDGEPDGDVAAAALLSKQIVKESSQIISNSIEELVKDKNKLIETQEQTICQMDKIIDYLRLENKKKDDRIEKLEHQIENLKKGIAPKEEDATCAAAKKSGLAG